MCEMLIRHECCGVGAPGSGGGTPCATSRREMEALLSCKNHHFSCAWVENTQGARVRKQEFFEENINSVFSKAGVTVPI